MSTNRSRKKNRFKFKERSQSAIREKIVEDPAYTDDVRHLAFPLRRNSGPEMSSRCSDLKLEFSSSGGNQSDNYQLKKSKKKKGGIYEKIGVYMGQRTNHEYSGQYASKSLKNVKCVESSSEEYLNEKYKYERGQSVDYGQIEKKRSTWFQRESHSTEHTLQRKPKEQKRKQYSPKRHTIDRTEKYVLEQLKSHLKNKDLSSRIDPNPYMTSDCTTPEDDRNCYLSSGKSTEEMDLVGRSGGGGKQKESSRFQIGKRFLKGEIGIKSFNYYLIKELKSTKKGGGSTKQPSSHVEDKPTTRNMEENIYEEIFFLDKNLKRNQRKGDMKRDGNWKFKDECELCVQEQCTNEDCEICNVNCTNVKPGKQHSMENPYSYSKRGKGSKIPLDYHSDDGILENNYAEIGIHRSTMKTKPDLDQVDSESVDLDGQPVLQFQSYNPNNPGVYKIETTPIANYNPFEPSVDQYRPPNMQNIYQEIKSNKGRGKSSSSSDSINQRNSHGRRSEGQKFVENIYSKPIFNQSRNTSYADPNIYKANSDASILSEISNRSEVSAKYHRGEMSDSSIGDSLFSYSNQRRYFGSSESCHRCLERCNYYSEDNNNYCRATDCHHCDCSSSYFSSDFDDNLNSNFSRRSSTRVSLGSDPSRKQQEFENNNNQHFYDYPKKSKSEPKYGEDFMRHLNNVKNSAFDTDNSYYSKPNPKPIPVNQTNLESPESTLKNLEQKTAPSSNKRSVKKKYYYDDIMTIPNEVAYNLSYGMIRRDQLQSNAGKNNLKPPSNQVNDFRIYEEIKEKKSPADEGSSDKEKKVQTHLTEKENPKPVVKAKETGTRPKHSNSGSCDELTVPLIKKPQPIYASPVKVKRIEKRVEPGELKSDTNTLKIEERQPKPLIGAEKENSQKSSQITNIEQNINKVTSPKPKQNDDEDSIEDDVFSESKAYENTKLNNRSDKKIVENTPVVKPIGDVLTSPVEKVPESSSLTNTKEVTPSNNVETHNEAERADELNTNKKSSSSSIQSLKAPPPSLSSLEKSPIETVRGEEILDSPQNAASMPEKQGKATESYGPAESGSSPLAESKTLATEYPENPLNCKSVVEEDGKALPIESDSQSVPPIPQQAISSSSKEEEFLALLNSDISDLPLPALPEKKKKKQSQQQKSPEDKQEKQLSTTNRRHNRDYSLPRSFKHRNEARAGGYLLRKQRLKTNSAEDLLFERRAAESKMHYHNHGSQQFEKPKYLFGETSTIQSNVGGRNYLKGLDNKGGGGGGINDFDNEIFLNKSGWVQVKQREIVNSSSSGRQQPGQTKASAVTSRFENNSRSSKLEDLITRNEARKNATMQSFYQKGFLPVRGSNFGSSIDSPIPPITPIISPPPAFQDSLINLKNHVNNPVQTRIHLTVNEPDYQRIAGVVQNNATQNGKGMVFSRSFEYDTRKQNSEYSDAFSKSFDYELANSINNAKQQQQSSSLLQIQRERMPAFATLTGNSPNYLTKKETSFRPTNAGSNPTINNGSGRSRDSSPQTNLMGGKPQMYPRKMYPPDHRQTKAEKYKSFDEQQVGRSRRAQFSRLRNESSNSSSSSMGFRSVDIASVNRRLNSCDSGARSDLSNDDEDDEDPSSSLALSYSVPHPSLASSTSSIKKQRSLTPDKESDFDTNRLMHLNLKKQRSLTPERRSMSLTPEERRKILNKQKIREYEGSRGTSAMDQQRRYDEKLLTSSRSSSSSCYSEDENLLTTAPRRSQQRLDRMPYKMNSQAVLASSNNSLNNGDYRIRRSRSLQLSERSPNKMAPHRTVVRLGNKDQNVLVPEYPVNSQQQQKLRTSPSQQYKHRPPSDLMPQKQQPRYNRSVDSKINDQDDTSDDLYNKSRSFDEDYGNDYNSKGTKFPDTRSFSNDRVHNNSNPKYQPPQQPQANYGTRLFDHSLMGTPANGANFRNRSPIMMDFRQEPASAARSISRDRSPARNYERQHHIDEDDEPEQFYHLKKLLSNANLQNNSNNHSRKLNFNNGNQMKMNKRHLLQTSESLNVENTTTHLELGRMEKSPLHKRSDSMQQRPKKGMDPSYRKPKSILAKTSVAPSSIPLGIAPNTTGSCTSSSCDFWPHCGLPNPKISKSLDSLTKAPNKEAVSTTMTLEERQINYEPNFVTKIDVNEELSSNSPVDFTDEQGDGGGVEDEDDDDDNDGGGFNFGQGGKEAAIKSPENNVKIIVKNSTPNANGSLKVNDCPSVPKGQSSNELRIKVYQRSPQQSQRTSRPIQRVLRTTYKSRSLPKSFLRYQSPDDAKLESLFSPSNQLQLRAVSSPSLSAEAINPKVIKDYNKSDEEQQQQHILVTSKPAATTTVEITANEHHVTTIQTDPEYGRTAAETSSSSSSLAVEEETASAVSSQTQPGGSGGVIQMMFRKTLSNFKGKPPANPTSSINTSVVGINSQSGAISIHQNHHPTSMEEVNNKGHRFGPLVWRTSKERHKAKHQRRDKCNSGDSGIHVELETDDCAPGNDPMHSDDNGSEQAATTSVIHVRRANSAKASAVKTSSGGGKGNLTKAQSETVNGKRSGRNIKSRSLSQPTNLNRVPPPVTDHDHEGSDTDSVSSQQEDFVEPTVLAEVIFPFQPGGPQELGLTKGAIVEVLKQDAGPWWWGRIKNESVIIASEAELAEDLHGWFPKDFVRILQRHPNGGCFMPPSSQPRISVIPGSSIQVNSEAMRENVIKELLETEINYVKLVSSICLGFLNEFRQHNEMFSEESIEMIFSNIEKIYQFQQAFLEGIKNGIKNNHIGQAFLHFQSSFMIYSNYCNSYSRALNELDTYAGNKEAMLLMEACRQRENLPELPLQAHLLAPIQRICKYPLHLMELVKHSPTRKELIDSGIVIESEMSDCKEVFEMALSAMRRVTEMVNEGKRNSESLARLQQKFDSFQGPSINVHSTRLFLQIDAIRMSPNLWNNTYTLFLFDRQLVMVKKDLLKRNQYLYKGRIFLDHCRVLNLPNGKMFGVTLKNALRIYCDKRCKWYDFCFRSFNSKMKFLDYLSAERQFCGKSLFLTELAGIEADEEYDLDQQIDIDIQDIENYDFDLMDPIESSGSASMPSKPVDYKKLNEKYNSETLPKKSKRKYLLQQQSQQQLNQNSNSSGSLSTADYTSSLGRRRIGNWFRKAKSTNSTPSHSPTHQQQNIFQSSQNSLVNSDTSSQNSPSVVVRGIMDPPHTVVGRDQAERQAPTAAQMTQLPMS